MALFEDQLVCGKLFSDDCLSSLDLRHQQTSLLQFLPQLLELLRYLRVATTRLADLSDLTASEANIRVSIIGFEIRLEFQ